MPCAFHLALPVSCLKKAEEFYEGVLGAKKGRSGENWMDFDFFGHQLSLHLQDEKKTVRGSNLLGGLKVPLPHFGPILKEEDFETLSERLKKSEVSFLFKPQIRFLGEKEEQKTLFIEDPFGNAIEVKSYTKSPEF